MLFKWHALGQEYEIEQSELIRNVARSGALLTGILAKGSLAEDAPTYTNTRRIVVPV
jgi:hypothetical protein